MMSIDDEIIQTTFVYLLNIMCCTACANKYYSVDVKQIVSPKISQTSTKQEHDPTCQDWISVPTFNIAVAVVNNTKCSSTCEKEPTRNTQIFITRYCAMVTPLLTTPWS